MPEEARRGRRSSDLYCPIRKNYELAQKNEKECCQHGVPRTEASQAISLLPVMLWQYQREVWLLEILKFMRYC